MRAVLKPREDGLAIELSADTVRRFGLRAGQVVDVSPHDLGIDREDGLPSRPTAASYDLDELVARMRPENEPELVEWGPNVGSEIIDDAYSRGEITLDDILAHRDARRG